MKIQPSTRAEATAPPVRERTVKWPLMLLTWGVPALTVALLLPRLVVFVQLGISRLGFPWQMDYTEGVNLHSTLELAQGHNIYPHNGPDAFFSTPYPPVFYLLTAPFTWITGPSFGPGRLISLLSTVALAGLIVYIVWALTSHLSAGLFAGAVWLSTSPVIVWAAYDKQDLLALALDLAGLVCVVRFAVRRAPNPQSVLTIPRSAIIVAAILFALAIYTKQTALSGAAASTLWLLLSDRRAGVQLLALLIALCGVPFLLGNLLLHGGLWEHLVFNHTLPSTEKQFSNTMAPLRYEYWPLIIIGCATLLSLLVSFARRGSECASTQAHLGRMRATVSDPKTPLLLYLAFGWGNTLATAGHAGVSLNHLIDGLLPTCVLCGLGFAAQLQLTISTTLPARALGFAGVSLFALLMAAQAFAYGDRSTWFPSEWPTTERNAEMLGLSDLVARTSGEIFSDDAYLLLHNGRPIIYDDPFTMAALADQQKWDDSEFNQSLRDRRFSLVLVKHGEVRWTDVGLTAFLSNYARKFAGTEDAYEPKLVPDTPQYALECTLQQGDESVALLGYSLPPAVAQTGIRPSEVLRVTLYWQATSRLQHNFASYVHLLAENGEAIGGQDNPNTGASQPTTAWQPGVPLTDTASIPIPANLQNGRYRLIAGMYRVESGNLVPLPAQCKQGEAFGDGISLGSVRVQR